MDRWMYDIDSPAVFLGRIRAMWAVGRAEGLGPWPWGWVGACLLGRLGGGRGRRGLELP